MKKILFLLFPCIIIFFNGCSSTEFNLNSCKKTVRQIYSSGQYDKELKEAVSEGEKGIEFPDSGKLAAVFDVDETALSNYSYLNSVDFGYISEQWDSWILTGKADAIVPVLELYKRLITKGVHIIFITGRTANQYESTYSNLVNTGFYKFDTLIVRKKTGENNNASITKEVERQKITEAGYTIIACIGDQWSDMDGKYTGKKIKLPNYVYLIN